MKLTYHWEGNYLIPDLIVPDVPQIGIWDERRRQFLRKHQKPLYDALLMKGKLNAYLEEIDRHAGEMIERLMEQLAKKEGVTEALKASDQMLWVQRMNSIRKRAKEVVMSDLIHS